MGYNSRQLKASPDPKAPAKPKDVIVDPKGQWKHPGKVTKIPSNNITMKGVPYPVLGIDNLGNQKMMQPGMEYIFPGADSVTEYPQIKGWLDQLQDGGTREPIITNDPKDPRITAYNDSLNTFKWNKKALADVIKSKKTPGGKALSNDPPKLVSKKQQVEIELQRVKDWGLNLSKKDVIDDLEHYDGINRGTGKLNKAVSYFNFTDHKGQPIFKLAQYKKPVQPYLYQPPKPPEETPPVKKDTVKTVVKPIESDTTRKWDFNGSVPAMQYFDKSGKLIGQDYYQNIKDYNEGKKIDIVQKQLGGEAVFLEEQKRGGSVKGLSKFTSKNIKTSVNKLMLRNETLFGERGKKIYDPNAKGWLDKYK